MTDTEDVTEILRPDNAEQLRDAVQWAVAEGVTLAIAAAGTKRGLGRPVTADRSLDLSALSGIVQYEPEELVLTLKPGTPMREVTALLAQRDQRLEFEPPDLGPLLGGASEAGTIGGVIAANLAGPRRIKSGAARDHVLGFHAVSGRGEIFKSGGRVVKNVTGFDLSKLMAGSFGTLALMTEVTVRALPAPERTRTALVTGLDDATATAAMSRGLGSSHEVSGAAHLPASVAARSAVGYVKESGQSVTALRVEGPAVSADARCAALRVLLGEFGETEELHRHNSATFWQEVRDVSCFAQPGDMRQVWRLSVAPTEGAAAAARIVGDVGGEAYYDWGGGLVWLAIPARNDAAHEVVRNALSGGHATLVRAEPTIRAAVPVFQPKAGPLADLDRRIKAGFDPGGALNPGRMVKGL